MGIFDNYQARYEGSREEELTLHEYLDICKADPMAYATAAERILMAIGEPELVDTSKDIRLTRIFANKVIKVYPAFREFYGMEETIEQIVAFFRHAAQGLEERLHVPGQRGRARQARHRVSDPRPGRRGQHRRRHDHSECERRR